MWTVLFDDEFVPEFRELDPPVQKAIAKYVAVLAVEGHQLSRPWADTLKGSIFANMKELRPTVNKVEWRVAFAFDPERQAILLAAAAKGGAKDSRVYAQLIATADERFARHLESLATARVAKQK